MTDENRSQGASLGPWYGVHDPKEAHPIQDAAQLREAAQRLV
jgi:hypothetical protein